ncbi:glycosyltransferase [Candidatus Saccharibacteria bacterium]|nr:glycosyltransferase [Candidatus Saccharibacteria bacterium]
MKIALVCDWLTTVGGAEQVLLALHKLYPTAPIYTSQYNKKGIDWFKKAEVRTGYLQHFPSSLRRFLGPLRQHYFSHLDLSDYDIIISVTGAEAKAIKKGTATHLCYCHVPTQYYWQFYDDYLKNPGFGPLDPLARLALKLFVKPLKKADYHSAQAPDEFITISTYASAQIKKYYKRESKIIHPPVKVDKFHSLVENYTTKKGKSQVTTETNKTIKSNKSQIKKSEQLSQSNTIKTIKSQTKTPYFINYSRQVTWKRLDLIVKSCLNTNQPLVLIGDGPEHNNLVKLANNSPLITFLPSMPQPKLLEYLKGAKAFIFPSLEPFGIAPVEALAAGVPVVAYRAGGALDFIKEGKNGLFFNHQTVASLSKVIKKFEQSKLDAPAQISKSVENFSESNFKSKITALVNDYSKNRSRQK